MYLNTDTTLKVHAKQNSNECFSKLKPKSRNVADRKALAIWLSAGYLERSAWWNNPQICSELSQTTHGLHQSWRRTFETFD